MTKPYPMEMRERAVRFVEAGESRHEVAARFGIAASTVIKWLARHARTGSAAPAQMGATGRKRSSGNTATGFSSAWRRVTIPCKAWPMNWRPKA